MKRLLFTYFLLSSLFLFLASCGGGVKEQAINVADMSEEELVAYAQGVHERVITLDTHDDINVSNFTEEKNYTQDLSTQITLPKMEEGGLDVAWFIVYTGQGELDEEGYAAAYKNAMDKFTSIHWLAEKMAPDRIELAYNSEDVRRISKAGKKVAMIGIENGYPIGTDISNVKKFYDLGARYMSLSHNGHSQLCDSNTGEADSVWLHNGVSELGKEVIKEMNRYGMMIDVSHPSKKSMIDMIELSKAPIIASHSSARALCNHSRNLDDEQLELLKQNGGVVQTVAFSSYLNTDKHNAFNEKRNELYKEIAEEQGFEMVERSEIRKMNAEERSKYFEMYMKIRELAKPRMDEVKAKADPVDVKDFVDHIDYLVKKMGLAHVGISSDFDGGGGIDGWSDASETFNVTLELVRRGYSEEEISQLWSGNLLRVLDECQKIAKEIQSEQA
ncbi:MAG: dipeptidase [Bacteroidia bacterium]|nr:dipeptidase [Bacteroidia bacterium]